MKRKTRKRIDWASATLLIIGGLVHGGLTFGWNAVESLLNFGILPEIIYGAVGMSAIYTIVRNKNFMR